jgi:hypothetical protein
MSVQGSNKASKTIIPLGKPKGNATHRVNCVISPEIVLMGGYNTHVFVSLGLSEGSENCELERSIINY